jgi:hypothetical protein
MDQGGRGRQVRRHWDVCDSLELEAKMDGLAVGEDCDHRSVVVRMDADTCPAEAAASCRDRVATAGALAGAVHGRHTASLRLQSNRIEPHLVAVLGGCEDEDRLREQARRPEPGRTRV